MTIKLHKVSKRYSEQWILRNVDFQFQSNHIYGIQGANGAGKSTLIKIISGYLSPTAGSINYNATGGEAISRDDIYNHCSLWGPHASLIGHLTIKEMVQFFFTFKKLKNNLSVADFYNLLNLPLKTSRYIKSLSSGQAQRLGLALTILCKSEILLLDEPGSFLDLTSLEWMSDLIKSYSSDRVVIIASNEEDDLAFSSERLNIHDYN